MPGLGSRHARIYHRYPDHTDPAKGFSVTEKDPIVDRTVQAIFSYRVDIVGFFDQPKKELQFKPLKSFFVTVAEALRYRGGTHALLLPWPAVRPSANESSSK